MGRHVPIKVRERGGTMKKLWRYIDLTILIGIVVLVVYIIVRPK